MPGPSPCRGGPGASSRWCSRCMPSTRPMSGCWRRSCRRSGRSWRSTRRRPDGSPRCCCIGAAVAGPIVGYLADRLRRPRLLAIGFAGWSLAVGRHRAGPVVRPAPGGAGAGGRRRGGLHGHRADPPDGRLPAPDARPGVRRLLPGGAGRARRWAWLLAHVRRRPSPVWQTAFLAAGAPGLVLALLALLVPEPVRGCERAGRRGPRLRLHEHVGPSHEDYIDLMVNSSYNYSVFGMAFSSFALAGLVYWLPAFLRRPRADAGPGRSALGRDPAGGGRPGPRSPAAGWPTRSRATKPRRLFLLPGLAMFGAIGCVLAAIYGRSHAGARAACSWPWA